MGRRILFLDIDGVLNSVRTYIAFGSYPDRLTPEHVAALDPVALGLIRRMCASAGVSIVLSSSWRVDHRWSDVGQALDLPIIDATPCLPFSRGEEIATWLSRNQDVSAYAIVDDIPDMLDGQRSRFVKICGEEGYLWRDHVKVCELLGASPYEGGPCSSAFMARRLGAGSLRWDEPSAAVDLPPVLALHHRSAQ